MTDTADRRLTHLSFAATRLGHAFARPKTMAAGCVVLLAAFGWLYLGLMAARTGLDWPQGLATLCRPFSIHDSAALGFALSLSMWGAMVFAMMLPGAGPMIFTYAEIADTAAAKGEAIVSPVVLICGYAAAWLPFAAGAAGLQMLLTRSAFMGAGAALASAWLSAAVFMAAGLYQFSTLKRACLRKCQHPFPFFFANWQTTRGGVFGLGLRQGLYCLGCCWAIMLVMFAVGAMNAIWMAVLGIVMIVEKMTDGEAFSRAVGAGLIVAGLATAAAAGGWSPTLN